MTPNPTFMLIAGWMIAVMGLACIVSEKFAWAFFYRGTFGIITLFDLLTSERVEVIMIRFGLG